MPKPLITPTLFNIDGWTVYLIITRYTEDVMQYEIVNAIPDLLTVNGDYISLDIIELETEIFRLLAKLNYFEGIL